MHGNVWEWTSDRYGCNYPNSGMWCDLGSDRVVRGGSWESQMQSTCRIGESS